MTWRGFLAILAVLFVFYTSVAGHLPLYDDELYYWCWSKDLQLSYYDHPPLTALMIRASTAVFGDTLFAIRLPACVATATVLGVVGWLTRPRGVLFGTIFTPLFTLGAVVITPDTPLLLFWSLYLAWLVGAHRRLTPEDGTPSAGLPWWHWLLGGCALGCGILGKYTAGLAVPAGLLSFALLGVGQWRRWLPGYLLHLGAAFLVGLPILIHNASTGFAPLVYQWQHATGGDSQVGWKPLAEFVGVQILLSGSLPLILLPWVAWRFPTLVANPRLRVCVCLYAVPLAFFLFKSVGGHLEANWALVSYLAFWPLAARWFDGLDQLSWGWRTVWRWVGRLSFAAPVLSVAFLGTHLVHPLPVIPPDKDRITRQVDREELADDIAVGLAKQPEKLPIFTDNYQWVAKLRFHGVPALQEEGVSRPSHFTQVPQHMADHDAVYYVANGRLEEKENDAGVKGVFRRHVALFDPPTKVAEFPLVVRGVTVETYTLWLYRKASAARPSYASPLSTPVHP